MQRESSLRYLHQRQLELFIRKITLTASSSGLFGECELLPIYLDIFGMVQKRQKETSISEAFCGKEINRNIGAGGKQDSNIGEKIKLI